METLQVRTRSRTETLDITGEVRRVVQASGVIEGLCLVNCPHTTAGIAVQEHADPDVMRDVSSLLAELAPESARWRHAEGNADAHVKSALVGSSKVLPISDGQLVLGTWQGVFFCEFDGPRSRTVQIQVVGS